MCLTNASVKEVTKDIICYKVYLSYNNGDILSPYQDSPMPELNKIAETTLEALYKPYYPFGGFYSFKNLKDALEETKSWVNRNKYASIIMKCIIPKDSKCYIGKFNNAISYCSNKIIIVEKCV